MYSAAAPVYEAAPPAFQAAAASDSISPMLKAAAAAADAAIYCPSALEEAYKIGSEIGRGSCSVVREAVNRITGEKCVVKLLLPPVAPHSHAPHHSKAGDCDPHNPEEAEVLLSLRHPCIVRGLAAFNNCSTSPVCGSCSSRASVAAIVMEDLREGGGEVFTRVSRRPLSERSTARCMWDLLRALRYLHDEVGVVHRDVKLENLMFSCTGASHHSSQPLPSLRGLHRGDDDAFLSTSPEDVVVKLIDFGFCKRIGRGKGVRVLSSCCGSPNYMSPEMLRASRGQETSLPTKHQPYGNEVDMWAAGVCMYVMLCGSYPFYHEKRTAWHKSILLGQYHQLPSAAGVSDLGADFLSKLLMVRPEERLSAEEALSHPWFAAMLGDAFRSSGSGSAAGAAVTSCSVVTPIKKAAFVNQQAAAPPPSNGKAASSAFTPPHNHHTLDDVLSPAGAAGDDVSPSMAATAAVSVSSAAMRQPEL